jgi:hypothetical protein
MKKSENMKSVYLPLLLALCLSLAGLHAGAQNRSKSVYGELLGASQMLGVNYDARFNSGASDGFGWRTGLGIGYAYSSSAVAISFADGEMAVAYNQMFRFAVPLEVNYLLGKGKSKFESGAGAIVCLDRYTSDTGGAPEQSFGAIPYLSLGYRLVTDRGFLMRVGAVPLLGFSPFKVRFYPYLGFGWAF